MRKRGRQINIKINFTNRWLYTLIVLGILAVVTVGVYALSPGIIPNPGHNISEMSVPSPCVAGQVLSYGGTSWRCSNVTIVNAFITYTTGYEYCQTDCRKQGGPGGGCYNAIVTSDGSQTSCVSGSAAQKKCYCVVAGVQ